MSEELNLFKPHTVKLRVLGCLKRKVIEAIDD